MNQPITKRHDHAAISESCKKDGYCFPIDVLSEDEVSAWLALSPVTESNGCMRFVPGSHKGDMLPHRDTYADSNVITINYIAPHVRQVFAGEDFAVLVRRQDRYGHFQQFAPPAAGLNADAMAWHTRILDAQNMAMYQGVQNAAS